MALFVFIEDGTVRETSPGPPHRLGDFWVDASTANPTPGIGWRYNAGTGSFSVPEAAAAEATSSTLTTAVTDALDAIIADATLPAKVRTFASALKARLLG